MKGLFISFEGAEGCGKSTQVTLLAKRFRQDGRTVKTVREPGGTPIGEEIRHTLKHSKENQAMTPEAELLLLNASRAQLVREVIRPSLASGEVVICDRFSDSSIAYQAFGRGLDLAIVERVIELAVGDTRPDLTLLLEVHAAAGKARVAERQSKETVQRDRFEEADAAFFERVNQGFLALAAKEPKRIKRIDANGPVEQVAELIWRQVAVLL